MQTQSFVSLKKYACELAEEKEFSSAFPFFCLRVYFPDLSEEQIKAAIFGLGSNDESIDAFWINEDNKTINIAQFKSVDKENNMTNVKKETLAYLSVVEHKLADFAYMSSHKNKRIKEDIYYDYNECKNKGYAVKKMIFHLGYPNKDLLEHYGDIEYYGYTDIIEKWEEYDSINSFTDPEECQLNISFNDCNQDENYGKIIRFRPTSKYSTIITMISGDELVKIRKVYKYQLFDRNVRYYLGSSNKINKEIYDTAKNKPDNFYYYNNGITITCFRCKPSTVKDIVRMNLEMPQIINGAQTVNAIFEAYNDMLRKKKAESGDEEKARIECDMHFARIKVLCRIIESTKHAEADFSMNLTRFTNSQNSVNVSDFYANRPEQIELQKRLIKYGYFYERKRGEKDRFKKGDDNQYGVLFSELKNNCFTLDLPIVAGIFQAYNGKPASREVGDKYILDNSRNDYQQLFGNSRSDITDDKVKEIVLAINVFYSVEHYSKLYSRLMKSMALLEAGNSSDDTFMKFKSLLSELVFLPHNLRNDITPKQSIKEMQEEDLLKRLYNYRLISQGKYLITAIIHEILKRQKMKEKLFEDGVYENYDYIKNNITTIWLNKIIIKLINPIRDKEKEKRSDNAFFLDPDSFISIKERISNLIYEEDMDLLKEYPI